MQFVSWSLGVLSKLTKLDFGFLLGFFGQILANLGFLGSCSLGSWWVLRFLGKLSKSLTWPHPVPTILFCWPAAQADGHFDGSREQELLDSGHIVKYAREILTTTMIGWCVVTVLGNQPVTRLLCFEFVWCVCVCVLGEGFLGWDFCLELFGFGRASYDIPGRRFCQSSAPAGGFGLGLRLTSRLLTFWKLIEVLPTDWKQLHQLWGDAMWLPRPSMEQVGLSYLGRLRNWSFFLPSPPPPRH